MRRDRIELSTNSPTIRVLRKTLSNSNKKVEVASINTNMNYITAYNNLINRSINRELISDQYYENHHIVPRCVGGSDKKENLVFLTPREHYIAHQLLIKIYPNNIKLTHAAMMMTVSSKCNKGRKYSKNRLYGWLRTKYSKQISLKQQGTSNNQYGTTWVFSKELQVSKKIKNEEIDMFLSKGWERGRVINFDKIKLKCKHCDKLFNSISFEAKSRRIFNRYCSQECKAAHKEKMNKIDNTIKDNLSLIKQLHSNGVSLNAICKRLGWAGAQGRYYTSIKNAIKL